jgi:hypothetical protein
MSIWWPFPTPRRRWPKPGNLGDFPPGAKKRRFREEKEIGDIDRQDVHATIRGITWPDSVLGD